MIIEFIGTPGAGKSTLQAAVIELFQERGIQAWSIVDAARPCAQRTVWGRVISRASPHSLRSPLLWQVFYFLSTLYRLRFFLKYPRLIWQVFDSQRRRPIPVEERQHALHWFFHLVGYYEFLIAYALPGEALVLDEGFVHRVVQMNASDVEEPDPDQILAYVNLLPRPDLVIAVQTPWEVCKERIYRRGLWQRFQHKSPEEVSRYVANSNRIVNLTIEHLRSAGWPLIEVDNGSDEVGMTLAALRDKLTKL